VLRSPRTTGSCSPYSSERTKERGIHILKRLSFLVFLLTFLAAGCAHRSSPVSPLPQLVKVVSNSEQIPLKSPEVSVTSGNESADRKENPGNGEEGEEEEIATITDPLEAFNRAMFRFNDKLYFWVLKPVAQGYKKVVPEAPRVGVKNFFSNLKFPIRFVSCLLQADFSGAATEFGRFAVNTIWGVGGLSDPASSKQLNIPKNEADLGQTLGGYGLGQRFYTVWNILRTCSARDNIGITGDYYMYPVSYISPWYAGLGVGVYEKVNDTPLRIGDYESLKEAAIDPVVAGGVAYAHRRREVVGTAKRNPPQPKPGGVEL